MTIKFLVYRITVAFHTDLFQTFLLIMLISLLDLSLFYVLILSPVSNGSFITSLLLHLLFPLCCYAVVLTRSSNSVLSRSSSGGHPCLDTDFEIFLDFYP